MGFSETKLTKKMKKKLFFSLIALFLVSAVFVSCGKDDDPKPNEEEQQNEEQTDTKEYTVLYDAENNVGALGSTNDLTQKVKSGDKVKIAGQGGLKAEGYTFKGWSKTKNSTTAEYTEGQEVEVTANLVLYSVWEKNAAPEKQYAYKVIYDLNDGSGTAPEAVELEKDFESFTFATSSATKNGKKLIGWATSKTATEAEYTAGQKIAKDGSTTEKTAYAAVLLKLNSALLTGGDVTLYAVYETESNSEPSTTKGYLWIVHDSNSKYEVTITHLDSKVVITDTWTKAGTYKYELEPGMNKIEVEQKDGYLVSPTKGSKLVYISIGNITELSGPKSSTSTEYFKD